MKPSFHAPLAVIPWDDEKKAPLCQNTNSVRGSPAPLLTCWGSVVFWEAWEHMSGVFCSTGFLVLETEAQGVISESWIPCVPEETTDRNYLDMLSSTGQQLPRLPLGATAVSQQECRLYKVFKSIFFLYLEV